MARYRSFLFTNVSLSAQKLTLEERESNHLVRVLRARMGDTVEVLDGRGNCFLGYIDQADSKAVRVAIESLERSPKQSPKITLVQSIPKGKRMDLILRIATEIGAARVQPIFTAQGDVHIKEERLLPKMEKWKLTMIEACKQCGLRFLPDLANPVTVEEFLINLSGAKNSLRIVASLEPSTIPLREVLLNDRSMDEVIVAVGPEGDFTSSEYAQLKTHGFKPVRLGNNILRSETAVAYVLSVIDQCL